MTTGSGSMSLGVMLYVVILLRVVAPVTSWTVSFNEISRSPRLVFRGSSRFHAKRYSAQEENPSKSRRQRNQRNRDEEEDADEWEPFMMQDDDEEEILDNEEDGDDDNASRDTVEVTSSLKEEKDSSSGSSFHKSAEDATRTVERAVKDSIREGGWSSTELEAEVQREDSCWRLYSNELKKAVALVEQNLVERDEEARLVVLGLISGENILLVGPPGTGKSVLGRRLSTLAGGPFFSLLLTKFTTPEELFGPLSLQALEQDIYQRCTSGYLPESSVGFLDEIFKAHSAILNTLLGILNEGVYAGKQCPIRCVIGASNELPESEELDALYDRFLIRKEVLPVSDEGLVTLLGLPTPGRSPCDHTESKEEVNECDIVFSEGLDQVVEALSEAANSVVMGDDACALLRDLRTFLRQELDLEISDRRLVQACRLLKISAASHGRTRVDPIDCMLLQHVAWRLPEQRQAIQEWLWDHLTPTSVTVQALSAMQLLLDGLYKEAVGLVRTTGGDVIGTAGGRATDVASIQALRIEAVQVCERFQNLSNKLARHEELLQNMNHLWLHPDEARAAQQLLVSKSKMVSMQVTNILTQAKCLEVALSSSSDVLASPPNEMRLSVLEQLWGSGGDDIPNFTESELLMGMKEAKAKFDSETFRRWKREYKKFKRLAKNNE